MKYIIDLPDDWRPPKTKDCPTSCPWFEWDGDDCNVYCHPAKCPLANALALRDEERKQGEGLVDDVKKWLSGFSTTLKYCEDNKLENYCFMQREDEQELIAILERHTAKDGVE